MRKSIFYAFLVCIFLVSFSSCSKDDDDASSLNETEQKLIGKWYFQDPSVHGYSTNNSFTFTSNKHVTYSHALDENYFGSEIGLFSVNGDVLTMTFPEGVELVFVQKVVFITDKKVQFVKAEGSNEVPYWGTYYKAN